MENQTSDRIQLLLVTSPGDELSAVRVVFERHALIDMFPCQNLEAALALMAQQAIEVVCLFAGADVRLSIAQLKALDSRLLIVVLTSPETRNNTAGLMREEPQAAVLSLDDAMLPCFPVLLRKLIGYERARRLEAEFYQSLRAERDRLLALATIDQHILNIVDNPEDVVRLILDYALESLHLPKGFVFVIHDHQRLDDFLLAVGYSHPQDYKTLLVENWDQAKSTYEKLGPQSYVVCDSIHENCPDLSTWATDENIGAALSVSLWFEGSVAGVLALQDDHDRSWQEAEIKMVQMLAGLASIAVEKALLVRQLRRRLEDTEIVNQALISANMTLAPQNVLTVTCQQIRRALNASLVVAGIIEHNQIVIVSEDRDSAYPTAINDVVDLPQTPFLQYALLTQRTLVFTNVQTDIPRLVHHLRRTQACGLLITPLIVRDKVIGMVNVESAEPRTFTRREIELVKLIVTATVPALENSQLFQEVQAAHQRTEDALVHLQRLDALKTQFIQNVSHELRTPLAIVQGYIDLTLDSALGDDMEPVLKQAFQAIRENMHHLSKLVDSITVLEDAEMQTLSPTPQPILPLFNAALQAVSERASQQQLEIIDELPDTLPLVNVDAYAIGRVFGQILDNAIKFNRGPGRIWTRAWPQDVEVWLQVQDEGIGIPANELPRIFSRFYQVDGTTSRKYGGLGLGLAIVKEVVEAHGGHAWAESAGVNQGVTVTVVLPAYKPEVSS
jgi:signal transduction histidine kinase